MKYLPRPIQLGDRCRYFATPSKFPFSTSKPSTLEELRARAPMRIAKAIAQSDLGVSRREAERMLSMGIVTVNKECVSTPTFLVEAQDVIAVRNKKLSFHGRKHLQMFVANKLPGELVTTQDERGRPTLMERLKNGKGLRKLMSQLVFVGRLDFQSEGLILLTNNGALARALEHPLSGIERRYRVRVRGHVTDWKLAAFARGVTVDGIRYQPMRAELVIDGGGATEKKREKNKRRKHGPREWWDELKHAEKRSNSWLQITCTEGKNRQIRKVCAHLGLTVSRLVRVGFGPYDLTNCERGALLKVDASKVIQYLHRNDTIDKSTKRSNLEIKSDGKRGRIEMDHRGTWQSTTPSLQNTRGGASSDGNKRPAATHQNNFVK